MFSDQPQHRGYDEPSMQPGSVYGDQTMQPSVQPGIGYGEHMQVGVSGANGYSEQSMQGGSVYGEHTMQGGMQPSVQPDSAYGEHTMQPGSVYGEHTMQGGMQPVVSYLQREENVCSPHNAHVYGMAAHWVQPNQV